MISLKDIYFKDVLKGISFDIFDKRIVMLLGENGCGKTTLIKNILSIYPVCSGTIMIDGHDVHTLSVKERANYMSYIPQKKDIDMSFTLLDLIVSGRMKDLSIFSNPSIDLYDEAEALLFKFGMNAIQLKTLDTLSGGELQFGYILRAIFQNSKYIIMDEPCSYLDIERQFQFFESMQQLKNHGKTLFMSVHDPNLALRYADDIVFMHKGMIQGVFHREDSMFQESICKMYNKTFGNHFELDTHLNYLYWK